MEKINFPRSFKVYLPLIILFLLLVLVMPRTQKFAYEYKKGSVWMNETLVAQFDFPILKSNAQILQDLGNTGNTMIPYYKLDEVVSVKSLNAVSSMELGEWSQIEDVLYDALEIVYSKGIIPNPTTEDLANALESLDALLYIQKDRRASKVPASEVYTLETANLFVRNSLIQAFPECDVDSLYKAVSITSLLVPDLIFDESTTEHLLVDSVTDVSTTEGIMRAGQVIVSHGEIVTAEVEQLLISYKAEYDKSVGYQGNIAYLWMGNILIAFFIVMMLFFAILYCNFSIFEQYKHYLYLVFIFGIAALTTMLAADSGLNFYMLPFTLISLYLLAFFRKRMVFSVYFISLLPMLIFAPGGIELFIMYLVAGTVAMLVFGYFNRGWLQFVTAFIVFVVMVVVWAAFRLIDGVEGLQDYSKILSLALCALFSVAGYPLVYLFEKIFKLVSNSKLVDLSDTNNPILRELADKAPGTFQHSLQVMNLCDAGARAIGANVLLIRAGALYHDVGKIANPQCFTENEASGVRYHSGLSPKESAAEIIKHVSDGLALADKHGLPKEIKDFIITHHGTSNTGYFLTQYLNNGGDPNDADEFSYKGVKQVTKEQVVLMICDAVEAASRSLKDYSPESISLLVENIVNGKIKEEQFNEANISLMEISKLKEALKSYLKQMYHSRIAYPKRKESSEN